MESYPKIISDTLFLRPPSGDELDRIDVALPRPKQALSLVVIPIGEFEPIGLCEIEQEGSVVKTACWIRQERRGQGWGKATREALLSFAFKYLGAEVAVSKADKNNLASNQISAKLGYERDGELDAIDPEIYHWQLNAADYQGEQTSVIGLSPYLKEL